jgi:hypothetical protein
LITQLMQELSNEGAGARVSEPQRARSGSRHKAFFHQLSSSPLDLFRPVDEYLLITLLNPPVGNKRC